MVINYRGPVLRTLPVPVCALLVAMAATLFAPAPSYADWRKDAKEAAIKYADDKKNEIVKEQAKAAVFALYKKLYSVRSGASRTLSRALAEVAISAPELNELANEAAEAYGSGDPDKIREASEKVAVKFGEQISRLASNPETRKVLGSIIGSADTVKELSGVLGQVAAGTDEGRREAAKYVGETLISLTPAAGVVGFYQTAYGVMKYANDEFIDSNIEDLYRDYKSGKLSEAGLKEQLGRAPYDYIVTDKINELREEKTAGIADAAKQASDALKEHLTRTTDAEVIRNIVASFDGRVDKERQDKAAATEREKAQKEAENILEKLNDVASQRHGSDWHKTRSYDLDRFTKTVRDALKADGVLDPNNPVHVKKMSEVLSTAMVHGKGSKAHTKLLGELEEIKKDVIETNKGANCTGDTPALASRLWQKGRQLVAAKKAAEAIPVLKQSLEICPDEQRAAQLAELIKLAKAPTATQEFDGAYVGQVKSDHPRTEGSLQLTVKAGQVSGSFVHKILLSGSYITIQGAISGRVSEDGRITATLTGRSHQTAEHPSAVTGLFTNCPVKADITGHIVDRAASGAFATWDTRGQKNQYFTCKWNFTWQAARK